MAFLPALVIGAALAGPCFGALAIDRVDVHQFEDGPLLEASHVFLPGETVYLSCRLTGYQIAGSADSGRSIKLSWRFHASDAAGMNVVPDATGVIEVPIFSQDKDWRPKFDHDFLIPAFFASPSVRIELSVLDEVGKSMAKTGVELSVRGREIAPSDTLVARNLHFQRSETDASPLEPAVYHPGETLWARFDITGFKYGPKNRYAVDYGLAILRATGEKVFEQPAAADDTNESFYPQHYVPGAISLNLDPMVPEGDYILAITMRDKVGGESTEARAPFRIAR
jgi:hypothetical protein